MEKTQTLHFRASEKEYNVILQKMKQCNMQNLSAYLLKMAVDGMVINLNIPEMKEILSLLRYSSNNLNQIAKKLNSSKNVYADDFNEIKDNQKKIIELVSAVYNKFYKL